MQLVKKLWRILKDDGWIVLNDREGVLMELMSLDYSKPLPTIPRGSQTARIVCKERSCFFIYAHESSTERGLWGFSGNVFNQIKGQEIINWAMIFLKESETEGFWAEPANAGQLIRRQDWTVKSGGDYILNYPRGVSGCLPFHSRSELLNYVNDFGKRSLL